MVIPDIKMLTNFARKYIPNVTIKWETMKAYGLADIEKKTISSTYKATKLSSLYIVSDVIIPSGIRRT